MQVLWSTYSENLQIYKLEVAIYYCNFSLFVAI